MAPRLPEHLRHKQIRSYTLDPEARVVDHQTGKKTTATQDVLDGDLDQFLLAAPR